VLPNGKGGVNYEPVLVDEATGFNKEESLAAFTDTLYKHLRSSGCSGCHNTAIPEEVGGNQAPLHSDDDVALAHEYALTRVNFKDTANSKFVIRMKLDRHNCPGTSCATAATAMLQAVDAWKTRIAHMLPETPRPVAQATKITEAEVKQWIADDKAKLAAADRQYIMYTSLHELHNGDTKDGAGRSPLTAEQLDVVRVALSKALNSTARWAPELVHPTDVNGKGILYKFDIRKYWGYNQGVTKLLFGGSDDDLAFGNGKRDYLGNTVNAQVQQQKYNFTNRTVADPAHALRIWERILHGNVEGAVTSGTIPPYIDGFKGTRSTNAAGDFIAVANFEWVEAAQLIYTITRPDVYNAIMMNPMYADEMEKNLEVDVSKGVDSYDYMVTFDAITIDSRLLWRAKTKKDGWYWKTWDIFTGQLASGGDKSIFSIYSDTTGRDIRFPWWANPIPKFVKWLSTDDDNTTFSFVASLNQATNGTSFPGFITSTTAGCDPTTSYAGNTFRNCRHYTGKGGFMQSASEIIYDLPNGLQGYYLTGGQNQRRVDAFNLIVRDPRILTSASDNIAEITGYGYSNPGGGGNRVSDPRLNVGSSCIGCHADGMNRTNNDLRTWMDKAPNRLPKGTYGVDGWINNASTVARVKELYKTNDYFKEVIESDRQGFLASMGEVKNAMMLGPDKNVYVEPIIWTVEHVQRVKYKYAQTTSN
jgi:hypothetical protein